MAEFGAAISPPGVEAASLAAGLVTALRRAGLSTSPDRAVRLAEALRLIPPFAREQLYWTCRVVLVASREQVPVFDTVFAAVFDGRLDPADSRGATKAPPALISGARLRPAPPSGLASAPAAVPKASPPALLPGREHSGEGNGPEREAILAMASTEERLHETSFAELSAEEVVEVRRLVRAIVFATPVRLSRRTRKSSHNNARLDIRSTVRAAQRTGSDATRLIYAHRRPRPRQLVLLCDVSASMEPYTRVFLSLLQGAVAGARAEAFVFSTRLTRLTRQLAVRNPDQALARAAARAPDWAGGTQIAESLRSFIDAHGRRGLARGAVVVVLSDGWAQDDPDLVATQMERLKRLAYRIVWVNPRKADVNYRPLAGGMAAALPYCDAFVSGHNYAALAEVAAAVRDGRRTTQERQGNS
ncbi:VWA containing CoxE family protein [Arthrobacter sp. FB24]|uniref:vWA domain-containing protein n=1 Tax=Arthrobacter sp. (strain FB24) TaxID=290399 RepID=UPI0000E5D606|nr:VWA domain-containing protein [Arthrobacter sp. FB24]ABK03415.1 VWA containing CoxE family protein [Arthrobacter sp. FB24]